MTTTGRPPARKATAPKRKPAARKAPPGRAGPLRRLTAEQRTLAGVAATVLLALAIYAATLGNGFVDFDDNENVRENWHLDLTAANIGHWFTAPLQYMYTPLTYASFAIDHAIGGLNPWIYHGTNLVLHLVNVVLVFLLVRRLTESPFVAHVAAVAFAIHPINVDTVAWVSTRGTLLATAFSLSALLAYLRYRRSEHWGDLAVSCGLFLAAALSKSPAVVLPVVLFGIDYLQRRPWSWRLVWEKVPYGVIALTIGIVALTFRVDTVNPLGYTLLDRVAVACWALLAYVVTLLAPVHLAFAYAYPAGPPWYVYLAPLVLAALVWAVARSGRRVVIFGVGFFLVTIVLSQSVLLIDNFHSNRYAYLPAVGLFLVVGTLVERWRHRRELWVAGLAIVVALSSVSLVRTTVWRDTGTLMSDSITKEPDVAFVHNSRAIARYKAGDYDGALADLERTIELDPDFLLAVYYRGVIRNLQGDHAAALVDFNLIVATYGDWTPGYIERARTHEFLGDVTAACADWATAASLGDPDAPGLVTAHCSP